MVQRPQSFYNFEEYLAYNLTFCFAQKLAHRNNGDVATDLNVFQASTDVMVVWIATTEQMKEVVIVSDEILISRVRPLHMGFLGLYFQTFLNSYQ